MADDNSGKSFWISLPGILMGLAALITALGVGNFLLQSPSPNILFEASPNSITVGDSATLNWTVTNAESISIDQGVGSVANPGTQRISPTVDTTYTLTAKNKDKVTSRAARVVVSKTKQSPDQTPAAYHGFSLKIKQPTAGDVSSPVKVAGIYSGNKPNDKYLWLVVQNSAGDYWQQGTIPLIDNTFYTEALLHDIGYSYYIKAILVDEVANGLLVSQQKNPNARGITLPNNIETLDWVTVNRV